MKQRDRLEDFVKSHRDEFDVLEPSTAVWEKIEKNSKKVKTISVRQYLIRVAAVVAIVAISSAILIKSNILSPEDAIALKNPDLKELIESEAYYSQQVSGKMLEIEKCYAIFPDIRDEIENDLNELETMYKLLKSDLNDNVSNKAVIEAMIENSRYRLKLVDAVLEQIDC